MAFAFDKDLITDYGDGLFLLDLPQTMPGFRRFISSWFFTDPSGRRVVVDPGPADTIPLLIRGLESLCGDVDLVLLTHIHLDHSGGIGPFCARYPRAAVLAHPRAFTHLRAPRKLWSASLQTLGDVARMYGEPAPLDAPLIEQDPEGLIETFRTPGHAPHHLSFRVSCGRRRLFFAGEAAGMILPVEKEDGALWLRPATPPRFDANAALESMDLMASVLRGDELLCYAHWGAAGDPLRRVDMARRQTKEWLAVIETMKDRTPDEIVDRLLSSDPLLQSPLPDDLLERERVFMGNSVRGFLGFLNGNTKQEAEKGKEAGKVA